MRYSLLFAGKVLLGILLTYVLLLIGVRIVGHQKQKATVERKIRGYKSST